MNDHRSFPVFMWMHDFRAEMNEWGGIGRHPFVRPGREMELSYKPLFISLEIRLQCYLVATLICCMYVFYGEYADLLLRFDHERIMLEYMRKPTFIRLKVLIVNSANVSMSTTSRRMLPVSILSSSGQYWMHLTYKHRGQNVKKF